MAKRRSSGACNWRRYALAGLVLVQIGLVLGLVGLEALPSPSGSLCQTPLQSEGYVVMERQLERSLAESKTKTAGPERVL
eukprot:s270_g4.t1